MMMRVSGKDGERDRVGCPCDGCLSKTEWMVCVG